MMTIRFSDTQENQPIYKGTDRNPKSFVPMPWDGATSNILFLTGSIETNRIDSERTKNLEAYEAVKNDLFIDHYGKYVVIAHGRVQQIGDTLEEVKNAAIDANHRYVFRVEHQKTFKRKLRWPMRKKK